MTAATSAFLFDMDGVLVDVSASFRGIILSLVEEFTDEATSAEEIQHLKQLGGFNDDIKVSQELIRRHGRDVAFETVKARFDQLYQGTPDAPGMCRVERWLVPSELLAKLAARYRIGVVTGRTQLEVDCARNLDPEAFDLFEVVVTQDGTPFERLKPEPDTILAALEKLGVSGGFYVGDSVDDQKAARAAGLTPIGVIPPGVLDPERLRGRLVECGASRVLDDIKEIVKWA